MIKSTRVTIYTHLKHINISREMSISYFLITDILMIILLVYLIIII